MTTVLPAGRIRYEQQRHHFNVYYSVPTSISAHIQDRIRRWSRALLRDGTISDVGHSLFTAFDNRKQWEYTGDEPHWLKSWVSFGTRRSWSIFALSLI
jgi:hypothetical protein